MRREPLRSDRNNRRDADRTSYVGTGYGKLKGPTRVLNENMLGPVGRAKDDGPSSEGQQGDAIGLDVLGSHMAHARTQSGIPQHTGMRFGSLSRVGERRAPKRRVSDRLRETWSYLQVLS